MRRIAKFKQYRKYWNASPNEILEAPRGGDDEERDEAEMQIKARRGRRYPYRPHRRVNRSSPCAWGDECV